MKRQMGSRRVAALLTILGFFAWPSAGQAQGLFGSSTPPPAPVVQQDSAATELQPIPLSEIPLQVDESLARLQSIGTQISADPSLALIADDLPDELAAVSRAHERLGRIVLDNLSIRELWNLNAIWRAHEERLGRWTAAIDDELRGVARVAEDGGRIRDRWQLTSASLVREQDVPQPLVEQTERVLAVTDSLETIIRDRLTYLIGLKSRLDDGLEGVRHVMAELDAARSSVRGRMFLRTSPPIWRTSELREASSSRVAARIWAEERDAISAYTANNSGVFFLTGIMFVLFALLAVRLRDQSGDASAPRDESWIGVAETLGRPLSAAFVLTVFTAQMMWPRAPFVFWQMIALAAVVPLYRLLPRSNNPVINRTMRALLVLFAVIALADLLVPPSAAYRVITMFAALVVAAVAGWLISGTSREQMVRTGWGTVVWIGLQLAVVIGMLSFIGNAAGWTLLAETLFGGLVYSAFIGLGVVIGYRVIASVVRVLPQTRLGQASFIMRSHGDLVTSRAITALRIGAVLIWLLLALEAFEAIDPLSQRLGELLTSTIHVGAVGFSLEKILTFAVVVLLSIWIARFVAFVLDVELLPRLRLKRGVSNAISTVVQWTILGVGLLTAGSALGLQAGQLAIVFGALGVGIGFGLQNVVSNFVSGLILIFEQPVKVGDKVEITSLALIGEVRRIGIRASVVRTFEGAEVIVPNSNLISSEVVNWTLSDQKRRVRVEVGVAYGTDPHDVISLLKKVAGEHSEVLSYPEPAVVFLQFGDSALNFRLMFWTATFDDFYRVRSEVYVAVNDAFKEAGITIPFPQRDLHVKALPGPAATPED
ncbi:MAG: mechanosensitive ion channel [marine benthic group bacterium]|nr:mechanosensitive ion channel [Gemmatimonadota bacterium]